MTDEMKKELIRNINNSLGLYELNDFSEEDLKAYNTILNMLKNKKGEHYNSVDEIYEKYNNKVVFYNNKLNDPIQFVLNNNHSPEFTDAANDYSYVKCVYEDNKLAYESKVNALKNLNNKYKTLKGNTYYSEKDLLEKQIVNYKATYDKTKKEFASKNNYIVLMKIDVSQWYIYF